MEEGRRRARALTVGVLFFVCLYAVPTAAAAFRNVQEGNEAPGFTLTDLSGASVSLDAYKKQKAVILVFWATWSERSLAELRDIEKLVKDKELAGKGVAAIALNVDHEHMSGEDLKAVRDKAAALNLSFPVVLDAGLETFRNFGVVAVPATAVLGEGAIVKSAINGYPTATLSELRERVEILAGVRKPEERAGAAAAETGYKPKGMALHQYNLGRRLYAFGMADKAEPKLKMAAAADPNWAAPRVLLGEIYLSRSMKDPRKAEDAKREFEAAVSAEKENIVARTGLARVYWAMGRAGDAEREVDEALKKGASYPPALLLKAAVLAGKGKLAEAEPLIRDAIELNPREPKSHALAGRVYEDAKEYVKAIAMYRKAWVLSGE